MQTPGSAQSRSSSKHVALASIVTVDYLDEFAIAKYSYELFHGTDCQWFVRCDFASLAPLSAYRNVICRVFTERQAGRPATLSPRFKRIMAEKMNVIADAYAAGEWDAVIFMDADLIFTAPVLPVLRDIAGDVILTPHYFPPKRHYLERHGTYNGGFVFTRSRGFHEWWRAAYQADLSRFNEQSCLNEAHQSFRIGTLGAEANIGFWRAMALPANVAIPPNCLFLHTHLYQPLETAPQWVDKAFAFCCVKFLLASASPQHRSVLDRILAHDRRHWFEATLGLSGLLSLLA
jgi:hypothetical protein